MCGMAMMYDFVQSDRRMPLQHLQNNILLATAWNHRSRNPRNLHRYVEGLRLTPTGLWLCTTGRKASFKAELCSDHVEDKRCASYQGNDREIESVTSSHSCGVCSAPTGGWPLFCLKCMPLLLLLGTRLELISRLYRASSHSWTVADVPPKFRSSFVQVIHRKDEEGVSVGRESKHNRNEVKECAQ